MDFAGELYDEWLRVEPVEFMRADMAFNSQDELQAQIRADVEQTYSLLEDPRERSTGLS
jgi:FAD synthase